MHRQALCAATLALIALTALACSERRSTGPEEQPQPVVSTKLPAMDITENPIVAQSGVLKAWPRESARFESEFEIKIAESFLDRAERIDEIVFQYDGLYDAEIWLYDVAKSVWRQLEPVPFWGGYPFIRFLSELGSPPGDFLLDEGGVMRIGGNGIDSLWVELLRYHDDYQAVPLPERDRVGCLTHCMAEIVWAEGALWIVPTPSHYAIHQRYPCETIHLLDSAGELVVSSDLDDGVPRAITSHAGSVWTLTRPGLRWFEMSTLDTAGVMTPQFRYEHWPPSNRHPLEREDDLLAAGFDRLWLHFHWSDTLFGIPIPRNPVEGYVHPDWHFLCRELDPRTVITGLTCDGSYFYVQGKINREPYITITKVNLSGQNVAVYPVPVAATGAMAWDGEAMWLVHNGPRGTESQGLMASRFHLPL